MMQWCLRICELVFDFQCCTRVNLVSLESDAAFYLALFAPSDLIIGIFEALIGGAYLGIPQ